MPFEEAGTNASVYFVCNYLGGPMTQLPFVTPDQIKCARLLKKVLTGRLDSLVSTYPLFPGTEANYLRAQISRIACSTVCAPNGMLNANDDGAPEPNEEFEGLPGRDLADPSNWVHRCAGARVCGRGGRARGGGGDDGGARCRRVQQRVVGRAERALGWARARPVPAPRANESRARRARPAPRRLPHLKKQGRCELHKREEPEDDEEFEFTEEEQEEGPEALASVEDDTPVVDGTSAWTPMVSSSSEGVKYQVGGGVGISA